MLAPELLHEQNLGVSSGKMMLRMLLELAMNHLTKVRRASVGV